MAGRLGDRDYKRDYNRDYRGTDSRDRNYARGSRADSDYDRRRRPGAYEIAIQKGRELRRRRKRILHVFLALLLIVAIFAVATFALSHYLEYKKAHPELEEINLETHDVITEFSGMYGVYKDTVLESVNRSSIEDIDLIEQVAKDYSLAAGSVDYRNVTGREGYEYVSDACREYLDGNGDADTKKQTCEFHKMVRTAANPHIRKVISYPDQAFTYVEVYCDLTLVESNDTYSKTRWPEGIGSTIDGMWRLEIVKASDGIYRINEIDTITDWTEQRNVKYGKIMKGITKVDD
ncbi:MAG: hypothetical protein K6F52_01855 [Clostridia bacterium]|nr:hypothetical protein [Clostridia bacterium]